MLAGMFVCIYIYIYKNRYVPMVSSSLSVLLIPTKDRTIPTLCIAYLPPFLFKLCDCSSGDSVAGRYLMLSCLRL